MTVLTKTGISDISKLIFNIISTSVVKGDFVIDGI